MNDDQKNMLVGLVCVAIGLAALAFKVNELSDRLDYVSNTASETRDKTERARYRKNMTKHLRKQARIIAEEVVSAIAEYGNTQED